MLRFQMRSFVNSSDKGAAALGIKEYPARWVQMEHAKTWRASETAMIIVDMWDAHWCDIEVMRSTVLGAGVNETAAFLRQSGVLIIHAPSDTADSYYGNHPSRLHVTQRYGSYANKPEPWSIANHTMLPVDKTDPSKPWMTDPAYPLTPRNNQGCDGHGHPGKNWSKQMELIDIDADFDLISAEPGWWPDRSQEMFNILQGRGIKNILYAGVATNMCVLGRPFGIKAARTWGMDIALIRELTDAMYNPVLDQPYVSHEEGTKLQIGFIEKVWAGSTSMFDLMNQEGAASVII